MTACDGYLPVPTMSRDVNVRFAMTNGVSVNCQLRTCYLLPAAYCPLPTASCLLPAAYCQLPTARCLLPAARCLLPAARCLLPAAYCLLPAAYSLSPTHEVDDLHGVAVANEDVRIGLFLDDVQVVF